MKKVLLAVAIGLMLAGCTKTVAEMSFSEREALSRQIAERCVAQGTTPGTQRHESCLRAEAESEVATRDRRARVQDARRSQKTTSFCQRFGNTVQCF